MFPALTAPGLVARRERCVMTAALDDVTKKIRREPTAEVLAAEKTVRRAREQGLSLTGPMGC